MKTWVLEEVSYKNHLKIINRTSIHQYNDFENILPMNPYLE